MSRPWSKDIVVDKGTFGSTKACHVLADMMNQNMIEIYEKHKVLSLINDATVCFKNLAMVPHPGIRQRVMMTSRELYYQNIDRRPYPQIFKDHFKNVINAICMKNLEKSMRVD